MPRRRTSRLTLRTRATLLATALTGVVLVVASAVLLLTLQAHLMSGADALARTRAQDLLELAGSGDLPRTLVTLDDEGVAQVVAADGRVLAASHNVAGRPRISTLVPAPGAAPVVRTVRAPDDSETETYRLWAATGPGRDAGDRVTVYVGSSLESVNEASRTLRTALLVGSPAVLLLLALGTWLVLGGALRRVDRLRTEVDAITEDRLDRRVPEGAVDDEVGRLARTMNGMLARLEASRERQRGFVADVSHDLQSPLAAQRTQLEVALSRTEVDGEVGALARGLLASTAEMEGLVRDLLFLAAVDAGVEAPPRTAIDLEDLVLEEAARARVGSSVRIDTTGVSAAPAGAARDDVRRIVRNVLDNAVAHARETVVVRAWADDGTACVAVRDDGPGVPEQDRERIFDRFHRGDAARSRRSGGSGLGLAIARTLAERHGGTLELVATGSGAEFLLRLRGTGQ